MTKENIYYPDDNAFDRFYKRARYQANGFVAAKLGSKAADLLTTVPDFAYLICKLMLDPDVPSSRKLDLGLALLYVLSPLDLVPDSVPLLGKLDDAYAIAVSVAKLLRGTERDVILRHWLGEPETIDSARAWLDYFDNKFGSGLMKKVRHTLRPARNPPPTAKPLRDRGGAWLRLSKKYYFFDKGVGCLTAAHSLSAGGGQLARLQAEKYFLRRTCRRR